MSRGMLRKGSALDAKYEAVYGHRRPTLIVITAEGTKDAKVVGRVSRKPGSSRFLVQVLLKWLDNETRYIGGRDTVAGELTFEVDPSKRDFYLTLWDFELIKHEPALAPFIPYMKRTAAIFLRDAVLRCLYAGIIDEDSRMHLTALPLQHTGMEPIDQLLKSNASLTNYYKNMSFRFTHSGDLAEQVERVREARIKQDESEYHTGIPMETTAIEFLEATNKENRKFNTRGVEVWKSLSEVVREEMPGAEPRVKQETIERLTERELQLRHLYSKLHGYVQWRRSEVGLSQTVADSLSEQEEVASMYKDLRRMAIKEHFAVTDADIVKWNDAFTPLDYEPPVDFNEPVPRTFEGLEDVTIVEVDPESDDDSFVPAPFEDAPGRVVATIPASRFRVDDDNESLDLTSPTKKRPFVDLTADSDDDPFVDLTADSDDDVDNKRVKW